MKMRRVGIRHQRGMTLIELMVAILIGLVLTLAVTTVIILGESHKRTTTSVNDREQSGAYAALLTDRALRSAGSGLAQTFDSGGYGCRLASNKSSTAILPRPEAWPAPFGEFPREPRVAPVLIQKGVSADQSDVIMVMTGAAAAGDVPRPMRSGGATEIRLDNTLQINAGDILLVTQEGASDCLIEQAADSFSGSATTELMDLGGVYYTASGPGTSLAAMAATGDANLSVLGNDGATAPNRPQFMLFGVGPNRVLSSYDMLQMGDSVGVQAIADGVERLYAIYGIDTDDDGKVDAWVNPDGDYAIESLASDPAKLKQILAIRFALVLRSSIADKDQVSQEAVSTDGKIEVFGDIAAAKRTITLTADERRYRYQVIDSVVPLRNALLASSS